MTTNLPAARQQTERWLRRRLVEDAPELGSQEWIAADDRDPVKVASVCRAALLWLREGDPDVLAEQLRIELHAERWVRDQQDDEWHRRIDDEFDAAMTRTSRLRGEPAGTRRARLAAVQPRHGDYLGGSVPWEPAA